MDLKTRVFQAANNEDLVIIVCTIFDRSTCVMDGRTKLRRLRRATAVSASACNNWKRHRWDEIPCHSKDSLQTACWSYDVWMARHAATTNTPLYYRLLSWDM